MIDDNVNKTEIRLKITEFCINAINVLN